MFMPKQNNKKSSLTGLTKTQQPAPQEVAPPKKIQIQEQPPPLKLEITINQGIKMGDKPRELKRQDYGIDGSESENKPTRIIRLLGLLIFLVLILLISLF